MYKQCQEGHGAVVEMLLQWKADPAARDQFRDIPFHFCQRNGMFIPMMLQHTARKSDTIRSARILTNL